MAIIRRMLVTHAFEGPRFDDHGLDVDVLPDLVAYKTLLVETAKELWRNKNPNRERLPRNFETSLTLKFYKLGEGSVEIPLERQMVTDDPFPLYPPALDEMDEAVEVIARSIAAAAADEPLPPNLPKPVMPLFANYGKTLRAGESIVQKLPAQGLTVTYTLKARDRLAAWTQADYEDRIDLVGEVRSADVDGCNFTMRLDDGTKLSGKFQPEQERRITDALREHERQRVRIVGRAEFSGTDGKPRRVVLVEDVEERASAEPVFDASARPIWDVAADIAAQVPDEEWEKVPPDLSRNIDHYLYGDAREED